MWHLISIEPVIDSIALALVGQNDSALYEDSVIFEPSPLLLKFEADLRYAIILKYWKRPLAD